VLLLEAIRRQSEDIFSIWGQKLWNDRSIDRNIGLRWFKRPIKQCCTGYQRLKFRGLGRAWRRVMIFQRFWGAFYCPHFVAIGFKALYQVLKLIKIKRYWLFVKLPMVKRSHLAQIYSNSKSVGVATGSHSQTKWGHFLYLRTKTLKWPFYW
jgi:hypothetical protein